MLPRAWALLWSELSGRRLPARVPSDRLDMHLSGELAGPRPRRRGRPGRHGRGAEPPDRQTVRRLVLPPSVRVVYPLANAGPATRSSAKLRPAGTRPSKGPLVLRDRCPGLLLRRLEVDPGIHAFVRAPEQEREVLARIAEEPTGVWWSPTRPRGWWSATWPCSSPSPGPASPARPPLEVGAVEVATGWRRGGVASALLRFAVEPDPFEDLDLIASGLSWHWDLEQSGLSAVAYRQVLRRVLEAAGFESLSTTSPRSPTTWPTCSWPASAAGSPAARQAAFTSRLIRGHRVGVTRR